MMGALKGLRFAIVKIFELTVIVLVAVLTITVLLGVFTRFVMGHQAEFTDELARLLLIWCSFIGGALAFERKAHLGVDYFVGKLHPDAARYVAVIVQMIIIALALCVLVVGGYTLAAGQLGQTLPTLSFLSRGAVYMALPISGIFIVIFSLENMFDLIRNKDEAHQASSETEA